MKTLLLLRGAPSVGKSTWITENNLDAYAISADKLRLLFQSPSTNTTGGLYINPQNDKKVWKLLYELVEERMQKGEFTIVDATHSRTQAINAYRDMCKEHRYRCYVLEFSKDASLEQILDRNSKRDAFKFVPEDVIEGVHERLKNESTPSWTTLITKDEFNNLLNIKRNFNSYEDIVIFGDIHSSIEPINEYFSNNPFSENKMYIFCGDYFDRGLQPIEVFNFLDSIKDDKNVLLLTGNHELALISYVNDKKISSKDSKETIDILLNSGITKSQIRKFTDKLAQMAYFDFNHNVYCCTHGGIPSKPTLFTPSIEFTKGVGKYQDSETVDKSWCSNTPENYYSIHGHRNIYNVTPSNTQRTFNLNGTPEFGGDIFILELRNHNVIEIKNNTFNENYEKTWEKNTPLASLTQKSGITPDSIEIAELLSHSGVNVKPLGDDIFSINFDKNVFYKRTWDSINTKARGLFIDNTSKVIARSYNKFFNLNEREETKLHNLKDTLVFPVTAYNKENGFLGILSVRDDEFFIASKSTNQGAFKGYFEAIIKDKLTPELKDVIKELNATLVFEVIDITNDPHIIEYKESKVILLDVIYNTLDYNNIDYKSLVDFAEKYNFEVKTIAFISNDFEDLSKRLSELGDKCELTPSEEGLVLTDANNYSFKFKENFYNFWKRQRKYIEVFNKRGMTNETKKMLHTTNDFKVWNYLLENDIDLYQNIINIQKGFKCLN